MDTETNTEQAQQLQGTLLGTRVTQQSGKVCADCGASMVGEHHKAKKCADCRGAKPEAKSKKLPLPLSAAEKESRWARAKELVTIRAQALVRRDEKIAAANAEYEADLAELDRQLQDL